MQHITKHSAIFSKGQNIKVTWLWGGAVDTGEVKTETDVSLQDRKIEELRQSLNRYKKVQDMVVMAHGNKGMHLLSPFRIEYPPKN